MKSSAAFTRRIIAYVLKTDQQHSMQTKNCVSAARTTQGDCSPAGVLASLCLGKIFLSLAYGATGARTHPVTLKLL